LLGPLSLYRIIASLRGLRSFEIADNLQEPKAFLCFGVELGDGELDLSAPGFPGRLAQGIHERYDGARRDRAVWKPEPGECGAIRGAGNPKAQRVSGGSGQLADCACERRVVSIQQFHHGLGRPARLGRPPEQRVEEGIQSDLESGVPSRRGEAHRFQPAAAARRP